MLVTLINQPHQSTNGDKTDRKLHITKKNKRSTVDPRMETRRKDQKELVKMQTSLQTDIETLAMDTESETATKAQLMLRGRC